MAHPLVRIRDGSNEAGSWSFVSAIGSNVTGVVVAGSKAKKYVPTARLDHS